MRTVRRKALDNSSVLVFKRKALHLWSLRDMAYRLQGMQPSGLCSHTPIYLMRSTASMSVGVRAATVAFLISCLSEVTRKSA